MSEQLISFVQASLPFKERRLSWNKFLTEQRVRIRRFFEEPAPQTSCGASPPAEAVLRLGLRPTGGDSFGAVATLSSCTRGDGTSSNAPKKKPRMRTLSRNSALFLSRHRPGAPGSGLAWNNFLAEQRVRIRRFSFGAAATLSSRTRGDGTSSNAPKEKPRMRTLSRNSALFLSRHRPGASGSGLAWNNFLTEQRVRIRRFFEEPAPQTSCGASPPAEAVLRLGLRPTSAQQPRYPSVREGMERALTRQNESPAYELFPNRRCSLPVSAPAHRGENSYRRDWIGCCCPAGGHTVAP